MRAVTLVLYLSLLFTYANAQNTSGLPPTNTYFLKKLITENLTELENKIIFLGKDKVFNIFIDSNDTLQKFFYTTIRDKLAQYNLMFKSVDTAEFKISFSNLSIKTEYLNYRVENIIGNRYISRMFSVKFDYKLTNVSDSVILSNSVNSKYKDEILLDYIDYVQDPDLSFAKAELPKMKFIDRYLVPTVMVIVSGITIVLFFIIRSK
jgi:hypothetical protein